MRFLKYVIVLSALIFFGCDSDKFLGYQYDAASFARFVDINGQVDNVFDGNPVRKANINIGSQLTESKTNGSFSMAFVKEADLEFGKDISVRISANKYYSLDTTIMVFPADNRLDVELVYGAPIVLNSIRNTISDPLNVFIRATVFDYQGIQSLAGVFARGQYYDFDHKQTVIADFPLQQTMILDNNSAVYEGLIPKEIVTTGFMGTAIGFLVDGRHFIKAVDNENFEEVSVFFY